MFLRGKKRIAKLTDTTCKVEEVAFVGEGSDLKSVKERFVCCELLFFFNFVYFSYWLYLFFHCLFERPIN